MDNKKLNHQKKKSDSYGFIGSTKANKYSNPYQNNIYDEILHKDSKKNSKKEKKKEKVENTTENDVDVTAQVPSIPVVYYQQPIPYYSSYTTTPIAAPVAIQYVGSPVIPSSTINDSSDEQINKKDDEENKRDSKRDSKRNTNSSVYSETKKNEKEREFEEIMKELGIKKKDNEKKTFKEKIISNQLFLIITGLILFVLIILLYFLWPRMPTVTISSMLPYGDNPIQYNFPFNIENRDSYIKLNQINETEVKDRSAFVAFDIEVKFDVDNGNYLKYKLSSMFIEYLLSTELLPANVLVADNFIQDLSFSPRKVSVMTAVTSVGYSTRDIKNDVVFEYLLNKCGLSEKSSKINIEYKITMKMPVVSIIYSPTFTRSTPFECPFTRDSKYTVVEKSKEDEENNKEETPDDKNINDNKTNEFINFN